MPIPEHILASALLRLAALEADGVDLAPELSDLLDHADDDTLQYRPQRRAGSSTAESSARVRSSARRLPAPSAMAPSPTPPFTPVALRCASDHADDTLQRPPQRPAGSTATFNSSLPLGSSVHRVPAPSAMASPPTPPSVPITPRRAYRHRHHAESQRRAQSLPLEGLPLSDKPARIANFDAVPLLRPVPSPMISSTQLSTLTPMQTPSPSASSSSLSTPTTLVNPTPPPKFFQVLPPLQLPISTDVDMGEPPSPLSPLESRSSSPSPSSPSPGSTALHKRVPADHTYGNEEGETEHEDQSNTEQQRKRPRIALKLPAGNGGGGGGGGGGGPGPAHLWTEECVRNGDRRRAGGDATIGAMPCQHGTCTSCDAPQQQAAGGGASGTSGGSTSAAVGPSGNAAGATMDMNVDVDAGENTGPRTRSATAGKGKKPAKSKKTAKTKREKGWCEDPNGGPPLTKAAGNFLSALLAVWNSKGRTDLETVLAGPRENASSDPLAAPLPDYDPTNTEASYTRVLHLIEDTQLLDLQTIMALIQLALNVDSEIHQAALNGHSLSKEAIGKRITKNSTSGNNFREHVGWGYRFAFLAAGGTLGIIPIIASLDLRTTVTRHMHCVDIDCVGTALREVCHGKWLPMVKRLMLPIARKPQAYRGLRPQRS
ncbi:hypothetical protein C8F04DRAFT_183383 [Mycena alexandri]|uniref:Uncharacterized protein n=1 Tax=Mycena alexandri TaxID=1745969 RepID=A0AAD6SAJ0_9AGAR|nr:hypothetical protein C8F04DRAFT_183383 [Mycena alexandri]